jgi:hypothetical protein
MKKFVLVTATTTDQSGEIAASGIKKLKRGLTLHDFIPEYLKQQNIDLTGVEFLTRESTEVAIRRVPGKSTTCWCFTEFPETDIISAVKNLTRAELKRDLQELLPLKELA